MRFCLYDVIQTLKHVGYNIENTHVSYYSIAFNAYVNCSYDPIAKDIWIFEDDLEKIGDTL